MPKLTFPPWTDTDDKKKKYCIAALAEFTAQYTIVGTWRREGIDATTHSQIIPLIRNEFPFQPGVRLTRAQFAAFKEHYRKIRWPVVRKLSQYRSYLVDMYGRTYPTDSEEAKSAGPVDLEKELV
jgi:hypothetical protein